MAKLASSAIADQIQKLLNDRQSHELAIAKIDQTLLRVGSALTGLGRPPGSVGRPKGSVGRPKGSVGRPKGSVGRPLGSKNKKGRRHRGRFAVSGEQMVVDFVKSNRNATTKDINNAWKGEGRAGSADNALVKLVKEGRLKREKINGERGSRYSVGKE